MKNSYCNVAEIEIQVAMSSLKYDHGFVAILPPVILQTVQDARAGLNISGCKMFNFNEHFIQDIAQQKWDTIKLLLRQPHARNKQMGIDFVRLSSLNNSNKVKHIEKQIPESVKGSNSISPWKMSPVSKVLSSNENSPKLSKVFQKKLKQFTADSTSKENCYSRTAQMVITSKLSMSKANTARTETNNHKLKKELAFKTPKQKKEQVSFYNNFLSNESKVKEFVEEGKEGKSQNASLQQVKHKQSVSIKKADEKEEFTVPGLKSPDQGDKVNNSPSLKRTEKGTHSVKTKALRETDSTSFDMKDKTDFSTREIQVVKTVNSNDAVTKQDDDVEIVESGEVTEKAYTDEQVRHLRRAIKRFFNGIDLETFDPHSVRLKDLRRKFEEKEKVKLNIDGRSYFKEITMRFITIFNDSQNCKKLSQNIPSVEVNKRKCFASPSTSSIKLQKTTESNQAPASSQHQQCPVCFGFFHQSVIEVHAASCLEEEAAPDIQPSPHSSTSTVIDCSPHSCLTSNEQERWIQFSKEPKPYHKRLNTSSFEGCLLVRCPSCGLKYKFVLSVKSNCRESLNNKQTMDRSTEIEIHCDDCVEKVNSGCTRMGLYLVDGKKSRSKNDKKAKERKAVSNSIVID